MDLSPVVCSNVLPRRNLLVMLIAGRLLHVLDIRLFPWAIAADVCGTVLLIIALMSLAPFDRGFARARIIAAPLLLCGLFEMLARYAFRSSLPSFFAAQSIALHLMLMVYVFEGLGATLAPQSTSLRAQLPICQTVYLFATIASFAFSVLLPFFPLAVVCSAIAAAAALLGLTLSLSTCPN